MIWKKITLPLIYSLSALSLLFFGSLFSSPSAYAADLSLNLQNLYTPTYVAYYPFTNQRHESLAKYAPPIQPAAEWATFSVDTNYNIYEIEYIYGVFRNSVSDLAFTFNVDVYMYAVGGNGNENLISQANCNDLKAGLTLFSGNTSFSPDYYTSVMTDCKIESAPSYWLPQLHATFSIFMNFNNLVSADSIHFIFYGDSGDAMHGTIWSTNIIGSGWWGVSDLIVSMESTNDPTVAIMQQQLQIQREEQAHRKELEEQAGQTIEGTDESGNEAAQNATNYTLNVLQALISFRDMVNNIHATDCVFTFPQTGNLTPQGGRFNLGTINFCALSVPTPIMSLATIGITWLMIKLSIWLARQFYETFEEMLDGGGGK